MNKTKSKKKFLNVNESVHHICFSILKKIDVASLNLDLFRLNKKN
jgi:hypothetical protein